MQVLCLHGFAGGPSSWDALAACVSPPIELRAITLPGHGHQPPEESFDATVDALAAEIDTPQVVLGYSLGGRLGLALALRHPERVRAALLVGAHPGLEDEGERAARQAWEAAQAAMLRQGGVAAFVRSWEAQPIFASQSAEARAAQRGVRSAHDAEGLAWAMEGLGLGRMPSLWPLLAAARVPLWLATGALDEKFGALAARAATASPLVRHEIVAGAGHNLALEAPEALARLLEAIVS